MHVFIWNQFGSNHSGSFMAVGTFKNIESAAEAEKTLRQIISEVHQWFERPESAHFHENPRDIPPIEMDLIHKYRLSTRETLGLGWPDVRASISISTIGNLVQVAIGETRVLEEHDPLKDLLLRLGAEEAAIDHETEGEHFVQAQYRITCILPAQANGVEDIEAYLDDWLESEYGMDEEDEEPIFPYEITAQGQQMALTMIFPGVSEDNFRVLYDFLRNYGCIDIRCEVKNIPEESHVIISALEEPPVEQLIQPDGTPLIEWCEVLAGKFIVGGDPEAMNGLQIGVPRAEAELPYPYWIAKYPITYAQFEKFVADGGYHERHYWTEAGWQHLTYSIPQGWGIPRWHIANHPVVGLTYYDAYAYTQWLNEQNTVRPAHAPQDYVIRLPRETEWEKAARYPDGRLFPWGNEWDPTRLNWPESGIKTTTPVGKYPKGVNPALGIYDLLGNVYEWCLTKPKMESQLPEEEDNDPHGKAQRDARGGPWNNRMPHVQNWFRSASRAWYNPQDSHFGLGFRVVLSVRL
jgi:formylglycine-generating enzyme required for sulfatase activity